MLRSVDYTSLIAALALPSQACVTFDDAPYQVTAENVPADIAEDAPPSPQPTDPLPPQVSDPSKSTDCPEYCEEGCDGNECLIDCSLQDCEDVLFVCPAQVNCNLICGEKGNGCQGATLRCESGNDCTTICTAESACEKLLMVCSTEICSLTCEVEGSCKKGELACPVDSSCAVSVCGEKDQPKCSAPQDCLQAFSCQATEEEDH